MTPVQPVKNQSGAGFSYEDHFGALLAAGLLAGRPVIDAQLGAPSRIDFQVAADGWALDDLLVTFSTPHGSVHWCVSVKSGQQFDPNAPSDFVRRAWSELLGAGDSPFDVVHDLLGMVVPPTHPGVYADIQELTRLSQQQEPDDLAERIQRRGYVSIARLALWKSFEPPADMFNPLGSRLSSSPAELLRRLRVFEADFGYPWSRSEGVALSWCAEALLDPAQARSLWEALLALVATVRTAGGTMNEALLIDRLGTRYPFKTHAGPRLGRLRRLYDTSWARMVERWMATGVEEELAVEFARDETVGVLSAPLPTCGLVVLEGDFGSGKSVAAERIHQADISDCIADLTLPIPIYVRARDVLGGLEQEINRAAEPFGGVSTQGVRVILDGLDEPGFSRGGQLLADSRVLARRDPRNRFVLTARPGLNLRKHERYPVPPLTDEALNSLAERITGQRWTEYDQPKPVTEAVRRPLFALIALTRRARAAELPQSRALFIDALVRQALGDSHEKAIASLSALSAAAARSIIGGGYFSEADVGGPDVAATLIATRLIVRHGSMLTFALPILEQYFGAHAILRGNVSLGDITTDLGAVELWRYAIVTAIGVGSWQQTTTLIETLVASFPGAACWAVKEAVSAHERTGDTHISLPGSRECARRLRTCLEVWLASMRRIADLSSLTRSDGTVVTVGAFSHEGMLVAGLVRGGDKQADVIEFSEEVHPLSPTLPRGVGPLRAARPPAEEAAWPWRWTLEWVGDTVQGLLRRRTFRLENNASLEAERTWRLVRRLVGDRSLLHPPIPAERVESMTTRLLDNLDDQQSAVVFDRESIQYSYRELELLRSDAQSGRKTYERPWPVPDNAGGANAWVSSLYTAERARELIEQVYSAALTGYVEFLEQWLPAWTPTLGWGAALPIQLRATLHPRLGPRFEDEPTLVMSPIVVSVSEGLGVSVSIASEGMSTRWPWDEEYWQSQRTTLGEHHPDTAPWAKLSWHHGVFNVYGDCPATDLVYQWIWRDLHDIGLLTQGPPYSS